METASPSPQRSARRKKNFTEHASPVASHSSTMMWKNLDNNKDYLLHEETGEQVRCDSRGIPIKPFNPKITGRYNYNDRLKAIDKAAADLGPVELPVQLKQSFRRNYVTQNKLLDGYA